MKRLTLTTKRPCCGRPCRLFALVSVPAETYERRCRECETTWSVRRQIITDGEVRIDRLEWTDTKSHELVRMYGSAR